MPTRYSKLGQSRFLIPSLPSGFDGLSSPTDFTIPAVGVEDADKALFKLFDAEIGFQVGGDGQDLKKVPIIFAAGEKWALLKRQKALRDRNNTLILPLITVVRTTVQQSMTDDITGRGINQQTGELTIKRRLDKLDRAYQGLINRTLLQHQSNAAVGTGTGDPSQLTTSRTVGELSLDPDVADGALMIPDRRDNVFETIVVPSPQFYTAMYDVTLWAQYTTHMKQLLEQLMASFLPQGNSWRLDTPAGYWFVATVDGNTYNAENNTDDMSDGERILKYKFVIKVPAYILATSVPGAPVPVRRYISAPSVSFDLGVDSIDAGANATIDDPYIGSDDPTLPLDENSSRRRDLRNTNGTRLYPGAGSEANFVNPDDPALGQLKRGTQPAQYRTVVGINAKGQKITKRVRVVSYNSFTGETVLAPDASLGSLTIVATKG